MLRVVFLAAAFGFTALAAPHTAAGDSRGSITVEFLNEQEAAEAARTKAQVKADRKAAKKAERDAARARRRAGTKAVPAPSPSTPPPR